MKGYSAFLISSKSFRNRTKSLGTRSGKYGELQMLTWAYSILHSRFMLIKSTRGNKILFFFSQGRRFFRYAHGFCSVVNLNAVVVYCFFDVIRASLVFDLSMANWILLCARVFFLHESVYFFHCYNTNID